MTNHHYRIFYQIGEMFLKSIKDTAIGILGNLLNCSLVSMKFDLMIKMFAIFSKTKFLNDENG